MLPGRAPFQHAHCTPAQATVTNPPRPTPTADPTPRLLSLAAHELRSPLSVVVGYLHMLLGPRGSGLSPEQRRLVELAHTSCQRALALTHELSELARLSAGTAAFNSGATDLGKLTGDAVAAARLREPDVVFDLHPPMTALTLVADAERLRGAMEAILTAIARELPRGSSLVVTLASSAEGGTEPGFGASQAAGTEETLVVRIAPVVEPTGDDNGWPASSPAPEFDQFRGGVGLSLPIAVRSLAAFGGTIALDTRTTLPSVVIRLPVSQDPEIQGPKR